MVALRLLNRRTFHNVCGARRSYTSRSCFPEPNDGEPSRSPSERDYMTPTVLRVGSAPHDDQDRAVIPVGEERARSRLSQDESAAM